MFGGVEVIFDEDGADGIMGDNDIFFLQESLIWQQLISGNWIFRLMILSFISSGVLLWGGLVRFLGSSPITPVFLNLLYNRFAWR